MILEDIRSLLPLSPKIIFIILKNYLISIQLIGSFEQYIETVNNKESASCLSFLLSLLPSSFV